MRFLADGDVPHVQSADVRTADHVPVLKDAHSAPEALLSVGDVEGFEELVLNGEVRGNDEDSTLGDPEGKNSRKP